jgi:hypothetical protein
MHVVRLQKRMFPHPISIQMLEAVSRYVVASRQYGQSVGINMACEQYMMAWNIHRIEVSVIRHVKATVDSLA